MNRFGRCNCGAIGAACEVSYEGYFIENEHYECAQCTYLGSNRIKDSLEALEEVREFLENLD